MKYLVYFIDGTWLFAGDDKAEVRNSNVYRLNTFLQPSSRNGEVQISHYVRGLGSVSGVRRYTAGGFSYGINETVEDIYVNICSNYQPGDKIFIFGFSRGAIVARVVTGLISYGVLRSDKIKYIPNLWKIFQSNSGVSNNDLNDIDRKENVDLVNSNKHQFDAKVEFLGVFDSVVGGRGQLRSVQSLNLHRQVVAPCVRNAVQLLSLDERRSFFEPMLWKGKADTSTNVEQIWLPGVHSDIGGAYRESFLGDAALLIMIDRIRRYTNLSIDSSKLEYLFNHGGNSPVVNNEYSEWLWHVFSPRKFKRSPGGGVAEFIHPLADELSNVKIRYREESSLQKYPSIEKDLGRCCYFKSAGLSGRKLQIN